MTTATTHEIEDAPASAVPTEPTTSHDAASRRRLPTWLRGTSPALMTTATTHEIEDALAPVAPAEPTPSAASHDTATTSRRRLPAWLRGTSPALTFIGVGVAIIGFVLIAVAWGQVAGETQVYLQLPYLVSAGLTGLGLVMVGLTVVNVAAKRRDAADRDRQIDQLVSILQELKATLAERPPEKGTRRR